MKITKEIAESTYLQAVQSGRCSDDKAVVFYLKQSLDEKLDLLKDTFPANTLHAVAIKTCNNYEVLEHIVKAGCGLEAASLEEVLLAKEAGAENHNIVFDSPVKTRDEIVYCHEELPGIHANANSLEELERYPSDFSGYLGLRINPLIDNEGGFFFNVSRPNSKFGVPIVKEAAIIDCCLTYEHISCLHIHIGSSLSDFSANIKAIRLIVELANKINDKRMLAGIESRIETIDIGGGLDFDMSANQNGFSVAAFVRALADIPELFDKYRIITEYGKFVHRSNSFVVSNIEYVLNNDSDLPALVYIHVGADLFVRKVYADMQIDYPLSVIKSSGTVNNKTGTYDIVGPLCFAGDVLFTNIEMQEVQEGDKLIIYETGANTISMWSGHCSRSLPEVVFV